MKPKYGFRCQSCGDQGKKILYGVQVEYDPWEPLDAFKQNKSEVELRPIIKRINICKRCMRRFGLMERNDSTRN